MATAQTSAAAAHPAALVAARPRRADPRQTARLVALLGVNLWATFVMVPSLYLARSGPGRLVLGAIPLLVLAVAAYRLWPLGLLLLYPAALVAVPALDRALVGVNVVGFASFWITAVRPRLP